MLGIPGILIGARGRHNSAPQGGNTAMSTTPKRVVRFDVWYDPSMAGRLVLTSGWTSSSASQAFSRRTLSSVVPMRYPAGRSM